MGKYFSMNNVPIGTKMKIKSNGKVGTLLEIFHYPTTFKVQFDDNSNGVFKTHEVEIINNDRDEAT
tara:strand:- start:360 stop:557 length:198 start_codon:yes stop_codon:yes gene_type:complete